MCGWGYWCIVYGGDEVGSSRPENPHTHFKTSELGLTAIETTTLWFFCAHFYLYMSDMVSRMSYEVTKGEPNE